MTHAVAPQPRLQPGRAMARADQQSLKQHNLSLVLSHIASAPTAVSRADVAEQTGLTKATVSSLVTTLIDSGLVDEGDPTTVHGPGRPAIPLRLARGKVAAIGLEVNVDYLGTRIVDLTGDIMAERIDHGSLRHSDPKTVLTTLLTNAYGLASNLVKRGTRIVGAGLALPGIADHPSGPLRLAPNLGWKDLDIQHLVGKLGKSILQPTGAIPRKEYTKIFVDRLIVDNEANLAARLEINAHPHPSFIYVSGEVGIGAAIVVDGHVFSGLHGWAGEIGHITVDPGGPKCACGSTGCLEMYAGKASLMKAAGLDDHADVTDLLAALRAANAMAMEAVESASRALGIALANCMNTVDVSQIVLGGDFAPLADVLAPGLTFQLSSRVLASRWVGDELQVRAASAGPYPAITGGAMAVLDPVIADPAILVWGS